MDKKKKKYSETGLIEPEQRILNPNILLRPQFASSKEELKAINENFVVFKSRMSASGGQLIIGRYSVLPFYKELENDLSTVGAKLINSYSQHRYVADVGSYTEDLYDLTFRTWNFSDFQYIPDNIPLILKGETNSKKNAWNTHMFASNRKEAIQVYRRLMEDTLISEQQIYCREYVPLVKLNADDNESVGNLPITKEFRFFVAYGEILCGGFYWSNYAEELDKNKKLPSVDEVPQEFLKKVIDKVKDKVNFFVVDVAQTQSGQWIVVELNDGQCSGLSECDPFVLYKKLKYLTWDRYKNNE